MKTGLFLSLALTLSSQAGAVSHIYDYEAAAVLRDGKPCFYTNRPVEPSTPGYLRGQGVRAAVYMSNLHTEDGLKWAMSLPGRMNSAPVAPDSCILYGTVSPDKNRKLAVALDYDVPYYFSLMGEYGSYRLDFCLRKNSQGKDYLAKSEFQDVWNCTAEPLSEKKAFGKRFSAFD